MSRYLADRIERSADVEVLRHTEVRELIGEKALEALVAEDNRTGERRTLEARTLFVLIGAEPNARWLADHPRAGRSRFILTGVDAAPAGARRGTGRQPALPLETRWPEYSRQAT